MSRKTALIYSGSAYNVRFSLQSQLKNLVEPNDADVFIVTTRACKRRCTPSSEIPDASENDKWNAKNATTVLDEKPLSQEEINLIKETFGERLKVFYIAEEHDDYMAYLWNEREKMAQIVNWYIDENIHMKLPVPFTGTKFAQANNNSSNGTIRCVVDQYRHIRKCYELMEQYENENGFKYEWVMRARIDFIVPFEFCIDHYSQNHDQPYLYICAAAFRIDTMEFLDEYNFFSKRITAAKLFPHLDRMGLIHDRKYQTFQYNTAYSGTVGNDFMFDPETQFSMLLHELKIDNLIQVRIFRSAMYSKGDDGYDYFNYVFQRAKIDIEFEYKMVCDCQTDINEHLPTLRRYAEQCNHVTEMGIRFGNSTVAFLASRPQKFVSYDVFKEKKVEYLELIAKDCGINWELRIENPSPEDATESKIEETDLLFIDTNHHATQLSHELKLHAPKVKKWIILHDTTTFYERGAGDDHMNDGMKLAIEPFLEKGEWLMKERFMNNNGLMVLERINAN